MGHSTLHQRAWFLAKTDPQTYSIVQLQQEGHTVWDGVRNSQAVRTIRGMKKGDRVFIYHSMGDPAVVGLAEVASDGRPDPGNPNLAVADFRFLSKIEPPVALREIKESGEFADWALVRQSRLSTMPAPDKFVEWSDSSGQGRSSNPGSSVSQNTIFIPNLEYYRTMRNLSAFFSTSLLGFGGCLVAPELHVG
jgi:predicted RNA-binding protein with PUA-like domain